MDNKAYLDYLATLITGDRLQRMHTVLAARTRYLTVVLEDIYQPHNASAVLRSCDCFGLLDVHIIENKNTYHVNPDVALGSSKWLHLTTHNAEEDNTTACLRKLKAAGYRIVATTPHKNDVNLEQLPLDQKTALVFGNEREGLSPKALQLADEFMKIPMVGFTESLNISVSAAVSLYALTTRLRQSDNNWQLSGDEKTDILIQWIHNTLKHPELIRADYLKRLSPR